MLGDIVGGAVGGGIVALLTKNGKITTVTVPGSPVAYTETQYEEQVLRNALPGAFLLYTVPMGHTMQIVDIFMRVYTGGVDTATPTVYTLSHDKNGSFPNAISQQYQGRTVAINTLYFFHFAPGMPYVDIAPMMTIPIAQQYFEEGDEIYAQLNPTPNAAFWYVIFRYVERKVVNI